MKLGAYLCSFILPLVVSTAAFAGPADEKVLGLVRESRALMAEGKNEEALDKVKDALAVEGAGTYALANVYNVYSDWARAAGKTETADKSLLKAYDFLLKARDDASGQERRRIAGVAAGVADRLEKSAAGAKLLSDYRKAKNQKESEIRKAKIEALAAKRKAELAEKKAKRQRKGAKADLSKKVNPLNRWKTQVKAREFPGGQRPFPDKFPYTREDMYKTTAPVKKNRARGGMDLFRQTYEQLRKYGVQNALNWWEYILEKPTKINVTDAERAPLWNWYAYYANLANDHSRVLQGFAKLKQYNSHPSGHTAYRASPSVKMYQDLAAFPKREEEIEFPTKNIWVEETKTVHAKDFGWNENDATECLQKALDSGATTIIVDKMPSHWRIKGVKVGSNKSIIFEDGVKILAERENAEKNLRKALFNLHKSENVFIEGRGQVYVGVHETAAERNRYVKDYGADAFVLLMARNVVIRNLTIAENGDDAIVIGGVHGINTNIYIEDCVLDHNSRQAMSITCGNHIYMRRVKFKNTAGLQPMCGIDFEPSIQEVQGTSSIYLFDCEFENNPGGDIMFSESSPYPVTMYAKRCKFKANRWGSAVELFPLLALYIGNGTEAPSDIIFEDCEFNSFMWKPAITFSNSNLFHVTLRNCEIKQDPAKGNYTSSPVQFVLNREYSLGPGDDHERYSSMQGSIWFDNLTVTGFKGAEPFSVVDHIGHYPIRNIGGSITMNGRKISMDNFKYDAPELGFEPISVLSAADIKPPANPAPGGINVAYDWSGPWYNALPIYQLFTYSADTGKWSEGSKISKSESSPVFATRLGLPSVIQSVHRTRTYKLQGGGKTYYFNVPKGKGEAIVKLVSGDFALILGREKEIERVSERSYRGRGYKYFTIKLQSQPKVYGVKILSKTGSFRFFKPLDGLIATDPTHLPAME